MYTSREEQSQIIHDCFNGNRDRECHTCPARYTRGGICCFGDPEQHDPSTDDCQQCTHLDDCATEVQDKIRARNARIEKEAREQSFGYRPYRATTPPPIRRTVPLRTAPPPREQFVQINRRPTVTTPPTVQELQPEETLFQRFLKDTIWGMGQGFFETAAEFFRTHRLR